jgi:hypothetical protein
MTTDTAELTAARGSVSLVWMLLARSFGLAAGVAVALLAVASLLQLP